MTPEEVTQLFVRVSEKFEPITDQPSDADLHRLTETLAEALLPISWDRAHNGAGNLVGIVWDAHLYIQQFGQAFVEPTRPAAYDPELPDDATPAVRARREAAWSVVVNDFELYEAAVKGARKVITENVAETWYRELRHRYTHYHNVSVRDLLDHLQGAAIGLHEYDIYQLEQDMATYFEQAEDIAQYINMLEDAQRSSQRAEQPGLFITDGKLAVIASSAVLKAGVFPDTVKEWNKLTKAQRTWQTWKRKFKKAANEQNTVNRALGHRDQLGAAHAATSKGAYGVQPRAEQHEADAAADPSEVTAVFEQCFENLAAAATTDKGTMEKLVRANAELTSSLATLTNKYAELSTAYTTLAGKSGQPAASIKKRCKHCKKVVAHLPDDCWHLDKNASKRPANWKKE